MWGKKQNTIAAALKRLAKNLSRTLEEYKFFHAIGKEWRKA